MLLATPAPVVASPAAAPMRFAFWASGDAAVAADEAPVLERARDLGGVRLAQAQAVTQRPQLERPSRRLEYDHHREASGR